MGKMTLAEAEQIVAKYKGSGKTIFLDGTMSLRVCAAADYLVNHCGYIYRERKEVKSK